MKIIIAESAVCIKPKVTGVCSEKVVVDQGNGTINKKKNKYDY
jgi:hypothetical protein